MYASAPMRTKAMAKNAMPTMKRLVPSALSMKLGPITALPMNTIASQRMQKPPQISTTGTRARRFFAASGAYRSRCASPVSHRRASTRSIDKSAQTQSTLAMMSSTQTKRSDSSITFAAVFNASGESSPRSPASTKRRIISVSTSKSFVRGSPSPSSSAAVASPARNRAIVVPSQRLDGVARAVAQRHRLLGEVAQPTLVRVGPRLLRQADAAKGVVPVGRVRAAIHLAVEGDAEVREHPHVATEARLRRVGERSVPVEEHRAQLPRRHLPEHPQSELKLPRIAGAALHRAVEVEDEIRNLRPAEIF